MQLRRDLFWVLAALFAAVFAVLFTGVPVARAEGSNVIGWIEIAPAGQGKVIVTGHAYAVVATEGKFSLSLERKTKGNSAKTAQTGTFKAAAGANTKLSSTGINMAPGEDLVIELHLTVDGRDIPPVILRTGPKPR